MAGGGGQEISLSFYPHVRFSLTQNTGVNNSALGICISLGGLAREKYGQDKTRLRHSWAPLLNPMITLNIINQCPKNVLRDPPSFDSNSLFPFYLSLFLLTDPTWNHTACRSLCSTLPAVQVLATVHGPALQLLPLQTSSTLPEPRASVLEYVRSPF